MSAQHTLQAGSKGACFSCALLPLELCDLSHVFQNNVEDLKMPIEVLTAEEVARLLGCDPEYVNALAATHELPAIKIGRFWRFPAAALAAHLDAQANANLIPPEAALKLARRGGRPPDLTRCVPAPRSGWTEPS